MAQKISKQKICQKILTFKIIFGMKNIDAKNMPENIDK